MATRPGRVVVLFVDLQNLMMQMHERASTRIVVSAHYVCAPDTDSQQLRAAVSQHSGLSFVAMLSLALDVQSTL